RFELRPSIGYGERKYAREDEAQQRPTVMRIAPPQVGLLFDAPQPLQTARLEPRWRALDGSSLEINRRPEMDADGYGETPIITVQPQLAFPCPKGDCQKIRVAGINLFDHTILAHLVDRPEAGIECARTTQPGRHCVEGPGGLRSDTLRAAKQKTLQLAPAAVGLLQGLEDIGAAHAMLDRHADQTGDPNDRHAIGRTKVAIQ